MKVEIPNSILVTLSGQTSRGVKGIEVREADGHLIFTLTDGKEMDMGSVMGPQGPKGDTGEKGEKGDRGEKGDTGATGAISPSSTGAPVFSRRALLWCPSVSSTQGQPIAEDTSKS